MVIPQHERLQQLIRRTEVHALLDVLLKRQTSRQLFAYPTHSYSIIFMPQIDIVENME
jgi:hypothetical protein